MKNIFIFFIMLTLPVVLQGKTEISHSLSDTTVPTKINNIAPTYLDSN